MIGWLYGWCSSGGSWPAQAGDEARERRDVIEFCRLTVSLARSIDAWDGGGCWW
jgi:hypothetical protein